MNRNTSFDAFMAPSLLIEQPAAPAPHHPGRLEMIWRKNGASSKWLHYFPIYERAFSRLVGRKPTFLEIGVAHGGSLKTWRDYFSRGAKVVGIDNEDICARFDDPNNDIHVAIGDQSDVGFLENITARFGPFDAVLDDGGHKMSQIATSFGNLFPHLKPGGIYAIEDSHATYWEPFQDTTTIFQREHTIADLIMYLTDAQHAHYLGHGWHDFDDKAKARPWPTALGADIERIEVFDSIVVIHKTKQRPFPTVETLIRA